jgi:hypothetical protein
VKFALFLTRCEEIFSHEITPKSTSYLSPNSADFNSITSAVWKMWEAAPLQYWDLLVKYLKLQKKRVAINPNSEIHGVSLRGKDYSNPSK